LKKERSKKEDQKLLRFRRRALAVEKEKKLAKGENARASPEGGETAHQNPETEDQKGANSYRNIASFDHS